MTTKGTAMGRDLLQNLRDRQGEQVASSMPVFATVAAVSGDFVAVTYAGATGQSRLLARVKGPKVVVGDRGLVVPTDGGGLFFIPAGGESSSGVYQGPWATSTIVDPSGTATAAGSTSTAVGWSSDTIGNGATAIGSTAQVTAEFGTALGAQSEAGNRAVAMGIFARAHGERSWALGRNSYVTSAEPDTGELRANKIRQVRSDGVGATEHQMTAPDGTLETLTVTDTGELAVNGTILGPETIVPFEHLWATFTATSTVNLSTPVIIGTKTLTLTKGTWSVLAFANGSIWRSVASGEAYFRMEIGGAYSNERNMPFITAGESGMREMKITGLRVDNVVIPTSGNYTLDINVMFRGSGTAGTTYARQVALYGWAWKVRG